MGSPDGAAEPAAPEPLVALVAVLDHDGVYWPPLEPRLPDAVKAGELVFGPPELQKVIPEGAVYVDAGCDLAGGQYKWNALMRRFDPLPREQRKEAPKAPTLEQAFYDFVTDGGQARPLQPRVAAWVDWFVKTLDEKVRKQ
jgi:hypothetical protein